MTIVTLRADRKGLVGPVASMDRLAPLIIQQSMKRTKTFVGAVRFVAIAEILTFRTMLPSSVTFVNAMVEHVAGMVRLDRMIVFATIHPFCTGAAKHVGELLGAA